MSKICSFWGKFGVNCAQNVPQASIKGSNRGSAGGPGPAVDPAVTPRAVTAGGGGRSPSVPYKNKKFPWHNKNPKIPFFNSPILTKLTKNCDFLNSRLDVADS